MYNITIILSMHLDINNQNARELYNIIEKESPEIIFEEFDISRTDDDYYKNGMYKYQDECTVETIAIMNYLEKYKIVHIPVDTYEIIDFPNTMYKKISMENNEYNKLFEENIILSLKKGFHILIVKNLMNY